MLVGRKPLTEEEKQLEAGRIAPMIEWVYGRLAAVPPLEYHALHNLTDLFAADSSLVYLDWHHLVPEGNRLVAEAILDLLVADARGRLRAAGADCKPAVFDIRLWYIDV